MKVKIIESTSSEILEKTINEFLSTEFNRHTEATPTVIDIKYRIVCDNSAPERDDWVWIYSALIIYR